MKRTILLSAVAGMAMAQLAWGQEFEQQWWVPNGDVNAVVKDTANNLVYIGGSFNYIGPMQADAVAKGAVLNANTGVVNLDADGPDNVVSSVISDGQGGWYIMGYFSSVGGQPRQGLAQVNAAGEVTPFFAGGVTMGVGISSPGALALQGSTLYAGGSMNYVGPLDRYGTSVSLATGLRNASFPVTDDHVETAVPDGSGGWFIAGLFHHVGGLERNGLAWVAADGSVKDFDPGIVGSTSSKVRCLALYDSTLYIGGSFTSIGGVPRNGMAAVEINSGLVTGWDPGVACNDFALQDSTLYVGGAFTTIGGAARTGLAAYNLQTGGLLPWAPVLTDPSNTAVSELVASQDHIYFNGSFSTVNGAPRQDIASVDPVTAAVDAWAPVMDGYIFCMAASATRLYVGGTFAHFAGSARDDIAAFDLATGNLTSWDPGNAGNTSVGSIQAKDGDVFVQSRNQADDFTYPLVRYNEASGLKLDWSPGPVLGGGGVLVAGDSELLLGGSVYSVGGVYGETAVALDATTGDVKPWLNRSLTAPIRSIVVSGNTVYLAGDFSIIGSSARYDMAAINATTGELLPFHTADVLGQVNTLAIQGDMLVAGGSFAQIGSATRHNIAYFDAGTGALRPSGINVPNGEVLTLRAKGDTLYMGGLFTQIGTVHRAYAAALTTATISLLDWDPQPNAQVTTLDLQGDNVFMGGWFTQLGGSDRSYIGKVNGGTGAALPWEAQANDHMRTLAVSGNQVYAAGDFSSIGGVTRRNIAALDGTTGRPTAWNPDANGTVRALLLYGSTVFAGGDFTTVGGQPHGYIASINPVNGLVRPWDPQVDSTVRTIASAGSVLFFGGDFTHVGGAPRSHAASVMPAGGQLRNWDPSVNGPVYAIAFSYNKTIIGGAFSSVGGVVRNNIAKVNTLTGAVTPWDPNADGAVYAILPEPDAVFVGGQFLNINGHHRHRFAALNLSSGNAIVAWNVDFGLHYTNQVNALAKHDTTLYVGGYFDHVDGGPVSYQLAAIGMVSKTIIPSFNPGYIRVVNALDVADDKLYVGLAQNVFSILTYDGHFGVLDLDNPMLRSTGPLAASTEEVEAMLMPNPSAGQQVRLSVTGLGMGVKDAVIRIMSLDGKLISTLQAGVENGDLQADLSGSGIWPAGVYLVQVTAGTETRIQRLVVTQ